MPRDNAGKFVPGESGHPTTVFTPGNPTRFQPGQSGNPLGKPRSRVQFEQALVEAIVNGGTPTEAAELLWGAARRGEAWAIQNLLVRFWPTTQTLKIEAPNNGEGFNLSKLSNQQLLEFERLLEVASEPAEPQSGTVPAEFSTIP